jgi:hypothetical protein
MSSVFFYVHGTFLNALSLGIEPGVTSRPKNHVKRKNSMTIKNGISNKGQVVFHLA